MQDSQLSYQILGSVFFVDANIGIATGQDGVIIRTTDGGENWTMQKSPTNEGLSGVSFVNADHGFALGVTVILRTTDGGAHWITQQSGMPAHCLLACISASCARARKNRRG